MKRIGISIALAVGSLAGFGVADIDSASAQSSTTGAVRGRIVDKASKEAVIGATVVVQGPALQGQQAEITDESGSFQITTLPPGVYTLTIFYNDAQFSRPNVIVEVGKQAFVSVPIDTSVQTAEVIELEGRAPIVDQGSTKIGPTITDEYTTRIPTGRTFGAVLGTAAGTQTDQYGVSFSGSTSAESTYIVEGINTTDTAFGGQSTNLPNEFVEETEVIAGGYNAEFGRSTGGVINVVTKQGSNEFHGSVFGYFTPYEAEADPILREGTAISNQTDLDYSYDVGAEIGGPIIKDKLWFHAGVNPSQRKLTTTRTISSFNDSDNDGNADINEDTGFIETTPLASSELPLTYTTYFYTAKINGALSQNHQFQISAWGNPQTATDLFAPTSAPTRQREDVDAGAYDASAKWTSKFLDGKTQVDAVAGFHRGYAKERPKDSDGSSAPLTFFNYETGLADFTEYETVPTECNYRELDTDGDGVPDTEYNPCPLDATVYGVGGLGFYEQRTNDRLSGILSVTQRVKLAGYHTFKAGLEFEQTTYNSERGFTGGVQYRRSASGNMRRRTYLTFQEGGEVPCGIDANNDGMLDAECAEVDTLSVDTKNINYGAYLQDSWQILPNLTLNAGVRWEQQNGYTAEFLHGTIAPDSGEPIPDKAFQLNNQIAPRIGLIYDPTQEGRSKLFGHWGRFYETMPMDINVRAFGGEILHTQVATVGPNAGAGISTGCPVLADSFALEDIETCFPADGAGVQFQDQGFLGGATEYVAPGTKGQYLDEFILGGEYELLPDFKMGIQYVNRRLPQVIEDMSADSANFYLIGNPGRDYDDLAEELEMLAISQGLAECSDDDDTNDPTTCAQAFVNDARSFNLSRIKYFDKPSRDYDSIAITANKRFSKNALMIASYTYSREYGNFPGLYSTETGQLDPNLTSMYDLQDLMANRWGPMGLDRPHNLKVDGFYQFDLKDLGLVVLGGSFRAESGLPVNTLGAHAVYGTREAYLLPRGQVERVGPAWQADIHVSYGYRLSKTMKVEGFLDVFNLFNNQATTDVEEQYTTESVNPIVGGDANDLLHAKSLDNEGVTPTKFKNFGNETAHQAPLSLRLGARLTF